MVYPIKCITMWNKRRTITDSSPIVKSVSPKELLQSEFYQSSPIDEFIYQNRLDDGVPSVCVTTDIYMLFNQQRLDRMTRENLLQYFAEMSVTQPKFSELRSKLTDDQLVSFVKSRFIQSPSELMAWSQYLMASSDEQLAALATLETPAESPEVTPPSAQTTE